MIDIATFRAMRGAKLHYWRRALNALVVACQTAVEAHDLECFREMPGIQRCACERCVWMRPIADMELVDAPSPSPSGDSRE